MINEANIDCMVHNVQPLIIITLTYQLLFEAQIKICFYRNSKAKYINHNKSFEVLGNHFGLFPILKKFLGVPE
jgi:hypothetical protein